MSYRATKAANVSKKTPLHSKTEQRNVLLELMFSAPCVMSHKCSSCQSSEADCSGGGPSTRCTECVRQNLSFCDAQPLSPQQLRKIASQHSKLEAELEAVEEQRRIMDAKVERLRKQKKLWFSKMMRAVSRGIDNVEELERVEQVEAEDEACRVAAAEPAPSSSPTLPDGFMFEWNDVYPNVQLEPSLMRDFGLVSSNTPSGSPGTSQSAS